MLQPLAANFALILPVFLPIVIGIALRQTTFLQDSFWPQVERLTYYVLLPALIADAIATSPLGELDAAPLLGKRCYRPTLLGLM